MATLASTMINRTLKGFRKHDQPDVLATAVNASTTSINYLGILNAWGPTTLAEIEEELVLVTEVDSTNNIATVVRGWLNTTAASHDVDSPIYLNPRMERSGVLDLFNDCLHDLFGQELFAIETTELTYSPLTIGYDLDADAIEVLRVDALTQTAAKLWEPIYDWELVDNAHSDFASGRAIMIRSSLPTGALIRVVAAKPFTQLTAEADDLEADVGLRPYMLDLPHYYAMNRLMVDSERQRSQMQSAQNHQRAQDSPPFLALRTGEWYQARYNDRVRSARAYLKKETKRVRGTGYGS